MTRFARVASAFLAASSHVGPAPGFAADKRQAGANNAPGEASKNCEIYLHDGIEALSEHRLDDAERWLKQAHAEAEKVGWPQVDWRMPLGGLGALAVLQKKYAEAESLLVRSLAIKEKALGPDDEAVALALHNLAGTRLAFMKKYAEAETDRVRAR